MTKSIENPIHLDALVIAPHPDDAELGMGGGILKMLAEGLKVGVLDLTSGEPTPVSYTHLTQPTIYSV